MNSHLSDIGEKGYSAIPMAFDKVIVDEMRRVVLENVRYMSNTRPTKTAFHVAGFHRFPSLEPLHNIISTSDKVRAVLDSIYAGNHMVALGLSDITINRSQPWHTDLLRGDYSHYLSNDVCWGTNCKPCLKVLVYLQDGTSLQVVSGSHKHPIDLSDDKSAVPVHDTEIQSVKMTSGDAILMDIRMIHRGSTEAEMATNGLGDDAKILISTVFGDRFSRFAQSMQLGNAQRMIDWDLRNQYTVQN